MDVLRTSEGLSNFDFLSGTATRNDRDGGALFLNLNYSDAQSPVANRQEQEITCVVWNQ